MKLDARAVLLVILSVSGCSSDVGGDVPNKQDAQATSHDGTTNPLVDGGVVGTDFASVAAGNWKWVAGNQLLQCNGVDPQNTTLSGTLTIGIGGTPISGMYQKYANCQLKLMPSGAQASFILEACNAVSMDGFSSVEIEPISGTFVLNGDMITVNAQVQITESTELGVAECTMDFVEGVLTH